MRLVSARSTLAAALIVMVALVFASLPPASAQANNKADSSFTQTETPPDMATTLPDSSTHLRTNIRQHVQRVVVVNALRPNTSACHVETARREDLRLPKQAYLANRAAETPFSLSANYPRLE
jgi:hypothetical protein